MASRTYLWDILKKYKKDKIIILTTHYMEEAEHEFMRTRGLSVVMHDDKGAFGFPKMSAKCDFSRPVRQEQVLDIELTVNSDDGKTIAYDCQFHCEGQPVAKGQLRVACCRFPQDGLPYPIPIPDDVCAALEKVPS